MYQIELQQSFPAHGRFVVQEGGITLAKLNFELQPGLLVALHTEVSPQLKGQGIGQQLMDEMVKYAREHSLKVEPACPFVRAQFERHPEQYDEVWERVRE